MTAPTPVKAIDARGIHRTTDLLEEVAAGLDELAVGDALAVLTDDFEAIHTDVDSWARVTGHELSSRTPHDGGIRYVVVKGAPRPTAHKLVAVISSDRPRAMASPLGFARAAVLEGLEVSVFFRGDGVRVLSKFFNPRRRFGDSFRRRPQPHPHGDVFRLFDHGAHIYACGISMEEHGMTPDDLLFDNITIAEYPTMVAVMEDADIHLAD
jgi:predicted peroxiredoxin/TusA-related sulfurtransferase